MTVRIDMGRTPAGMPATLDLEELLATRLLVQGNSGSGKSHLLRRLLEQSAPWVQQAIIDPEGDYVTLAEMFGHVVVDAADHTEGALQQIASRMRQHRVSVVVNLENLETELQMRHAAAFLGGMFETDRDSWFPMLVVVDEAQMFAPAAAGDVSDEARKSSLGAMTNLMCRGRKRGLAGIIATQRLAKLAKNVAAEASNFLMGRTFLDIDMSRAADLLGMERRQAEKFRDLERGHFIALGPALSRRPLALKIGDVRTSARGGTPGLMPLPATPQADAADLIFTPGANEAPRPQPRRPVPAITQEILAQLSTLPAKPPPPPPPPPPPMPSMDDRQAEPDMFAESESETEAQPKRPPPISAPPVSAPVPPSTGESGPGFDAIICQILANSEASFRSVAVLYQDFLVQCRRHNVNGRVLDLPAFRRKLAAARAGVAGTASQDPEWSKAQAVAASLPEDIQGVFLLLARAAYDQAPCPSNEQIARARGSRSPRRALGLLTHMEERGHIHISTDFNGWRVIVLPGLEWETAPGDPEASESAGANSDYDVA